MRSTFKTLILLFLAVVSLLFISCQQSNKKDTLNIAAASNMQFAVKDIIEKFEEIHGIECELIMSSSGKLTAQIVEGAPYDVFLSADEKYPNTLHENKLSSEAPAVYARGALVLWTTRQDIPVSLESLQSDDIEHIAMANPKTAPYGLAAQEVLEKAEILDNIQHKLVYGESIGQANRFVSTGAADIGFTAKSVVMGAAFKAQVSWMEIPKTMYSPLSQAAILVKGKDGPTKEAKLFYDFLFSKEAKMVLKDLGYSVSE